MSAETRSSSSFLAAARSRDALDADYSPARFVPSGPAIFADWAQRTAAARAQAGERLREGVSYGPHARETFDFYDCGRRGAPLLVFIHGGFWKAISRHESGFVAPRWQQAGVHVAVLDYALAPEMRLRDIVGQTLRGLDDIAARSSSYGFDAERIVVAGHSAGGQLAAMAQCTSSACRARGLALLSGVFELAPVQRSYVSDTVAIGDDEVRDLSPARLAPARPTKLVVAVGEHEPVAFHEQSRALAWNWREHACPVDFRLVPGRNHFDLLDDAADPSSDLGLAMRALFDA